MNTCWSELWFSKIFQKGRIVCLIDVARRLKFGAVMEDVVCSLHLAIFTQIWAAYITEWIDSSENYSSVSKGVVRGPCPLQTCSISSDFVLWGVVSQTKYCYSPKVKRFWPPKILGWLRHCSAAMLDAGAHNTNHVAHMAWKTRRAEALWVFSQYTSRVFVFGNGRLIVGTI